MMAELTNEREVRVHHVDESFIVAEKMAGLLCVPGRGDDKQDCLIRRVQALYPDALIVHRLDMATSGLVLLARGKPAQVNLSGQFERRLVTKTYFALVEGLVSDASGEIDLPLFPDWPNRPRQKVDFINGKQALTNYRVISRLGRAGQSLLELSPITGRTHQLRIHLMSIGHPIVGDRLYSNDQIDEQHTAMCLHAGVLSFDHPRTGKRITFSSQATFC